MRVRKTRPEEAVEPSAKQKAERAKMGKDAELSAPRSKFSYRRSPCFVFVAQTRFRTFIIVPVSARKSKHGAKLAAKNFGQKAVAELSAPENDNAAPAVAPVDRRIPRPRWGEPLLFLPVPATVHRQGPPVPRPAVGVPDKEAAGAAVPPQGRGGQVVGPPRGLVRGRRESPPRAEVAVLREEQGTARQPVEPAPPRRGTMRSRRGFATEEEEEGQEDQARATRAGQGRRVPPRPEAGPPPPRRPRRRRKIREEDGPGPADLSGETFVHDGPNFFAPAARRVAPPRVSRPSSPDDRAAEPAPAEPASGGAHSTVLAWSCLLALAGSLSLLAGNGARIVVTYCSDDEGEEDDEDDEECTSAWEGDLCDVPDLDGAHSLDEFIDEDCLGELDVGPATSTSDMLALGALGMLLGAKAPRAVRGAGRRPSESGGLAVWGAGDDSSLPPSRDRTTRSRAFHRCTRLATRPACLP
ncbi:hypothetical protein THAOC_18832 [Thalassiosira oceanica]|uniref:Uncharacterized protein n=1 Tax=Thalassiosira oceanica TaxID=159749 RepID=K0SR26_THAOC|nr:hypothetical protein THAOC_18832 [Thalassiosira oceanica]|eukprot:EJK60762.1 hypothetical protein THAOC_18832 [Thalassiosira oceanica]